MQAYHFLKDDLSSDRGKLRRPWKVGETRSINGEPIMCLRGFHASPTPYDALIYAPGSMLCVVELGDDARTEAGHEDKLVSRSRTLIRYVDASKDLRLFAADCAERVLHVFEDNFPGDDRPRKAIEAARAFVRGEITPSQLSAANASASASASSAASSANAFAAAYAASLAAAAYASSANHASSAASLAASAAYAERQWQRETFNAMAYRILGVDAS